jgi:tetratricopeptide (TPR) repeat protein
LVSVYPQNQLVEDLDSTLTKLTQEQLVLFERASEDVMFSFKHVLIQEVAYALLVPGQRRALHASIAQWYEIVFRGDLRSHYPLLAHHWSKAEENKRAVIYFERAADQALRAGAYRESLHFLSQALLIADQSELRESQLTVPLRQARWRRQLAEAHLALGNPKQGRIEVEAALALLGEPVPVSEAGKNIALASSLFGFLFRSLGRKLRDNDGKPGDPVKQECLKCYYVLLWVMFFYKDPKVMVILTLRSLRDALNFGSAVDIAAFYSISMLLASLVPLHGLARYIGALGARYAEASKHSFAKLVVQETQGVYAMGLGSWDEAEAKLMASVKLAEELGDKRRWIECNCVISTFLHCKGRFEERIKLAGEIYRVAKHTGDIQAELWALLDEVESQMLLQEFGKAATNLDSADEIYSRGVGSAEEIWYLGLRTFVEYQLGRHQSAKEFLARALDAMSHSSPSAFYTLDGYSNAALVAVYLCDRTNKESVRVAKAAVKQVARYSRVFPIGLARHRFVEGVLAMRLGHAAKAMKEIDAAERLGLSSGMIIDAILVKQYRDRTGGDALKTSESAQGN